MNCRDFENLIALSVSGDLDSREAARVEAHLAGCESCRAMAEDLSGDLHWLQAAHREPADRLMLQQVRTRVMRRLESEQSRWNRPFGGLTALGWRWQWVAVTATVAFLAAGVAWWMRPANAPRTDVMATVGGGNIQPSAESPSNLEDQTPPPGPASPNQGASKPSLAVVPRPSAEMNAHQQSDLTKPAAADTQVAVARMLGEEPASLPGIEPRFHGRSADESASDTVETGSVPAGQLQAELFVVSAEEPDAPPVDGVRVRMPTSNPDIVVYWLMDEKEKEKGD